jgi:hypothetical protein
VGFQARDNYGDFSDESHRAERLPRVRIADNFFASRHAARLVVRRRSRGGSRREANNYALSLVDLQRYAEAKSLLCKTIPVARRVLGNSHNLTLKMRNVYAAALYRDAGASLDNLREAVMTLEEIEPTARRVLGSAHPTVLTIVGDLQCARDELAARETPSRSK